MSNPAQKKQMPAFLVLTIICLVAALALAGTNAITKGPIQEHAMAAQREAFGAVMTADEYIEMTIPEGSGVSALVEAKQNGQTVGYCVVASANGYAGPVAVTLGVGTDGVVTGAKIGDTSFAETSGFGSRWLDPKNAEQFAGISLKDGGAIEALSGATVTSTAVLNASNTAMAAVNTVLGIERTEPVLVFGVAEKKPVEQMALVGDIHEGSARGFASDVRVQLTMDANGAITGLAIESSGETPSFGTRCMEDPTFAEQFVGKTAPFAIGENIDALAGATVTSTAVVNAVNAAVEAPANPDAVPFGAESAEEEAVEAVATLTGDVKTGKADGFQSEVVVELTVDENGAIAELIVKSGDETPGFGTRCADDADFLAQFIGKTAPVEADVLAGASVTSKAVIEAVNNALTAPAAEAPAADVLTASAKGLLSDVKVTITLNEDGTIATMTVDASGETAGIATPCTEEAFLSQFVGKKGPFTADVVAGATFTSNAVINAVNSLFPAEEEAPAADALTASAKGLLSDVKVSVTLNEDGTIATMTVDASGETAGIATPCTEEAFLSQFIGKKGPFTADVVAGATFTSNAVINAVNSLFPAAPAGEEKVGKAEGFQSDVVVTLTVDNGVITGIKVDSSNETKGFGTRCGEDEAFLNQFVGQAGPVAVDVLSGATVTSNAVIEAVNSLFPAAPAGEEMTAKAEGFQSDVAVTLWVDAGVITGIKVDSSNETKGFGTRCGEDEAFLNQFVGQAGPVAVDVLSGATVTSNAVIEAVNSLFPAEKVVAPAVEEAPVAEVAPAVEEVAAPAANIIEAAMPAFGGEEISVVVTLDENGVVTALAVDAVTQSPGLGKKCAEDEFVNQFIGKTGPFALDEGIDAVSYATITSQAVVDAVNSVFPTQDMAVTGEAVAAPLAVTVSAFGGQNITVTVEVDENGVVTALYVDAATQTPGLGLKCGEDVFTAQFVGVAGPFALGENVDAVSYATITSEAVVKAVNELLGK